MPVEKDPELIALDLLIQAIYMLYQWDFRQYKRESLRRSAKRLACTKNVDNIIELIPKLFTQEVSANDFLNYFSIPVTEMFRDPGFFRTFREQVVPILKTYPFIKIWHVGCATGQEVFSMAIILYEEGLYERARIYGTDINPFALHKAKEGIFDSDKFTLYNDNYHQAGGKYDLNDYFHVKYDACIFNTKLKENLLFFDHNIGQDQSFGEMNLILCRNVLIYFDQPLQKRALELFNGSLCYGGFLCLGNKEGIEHLNMNAEFHLWNKKWKLYKKRANTQME